MTLYKSYFILFQVKSALEDFLAFMVLYNYIIPISLYVTVGKSLCIYKKQIDVSIKTSVWSIYRIK